MFVPRYRVFILPPQSAFLAIPRCPRHVLVAGAIPPATDRPEVYFATLAEPTTTGDNLRFVAPSGEVREDRRWRWASRGGGFARWHGLKHWKIDWEHVGTRMKSLPSCCIRNAHMMFMQGLTYTEAARGSLGVRLLYPNETFAKSGPGILADARRSLALAAVLNSRVSSFILRQIVRGFMFSLGNLAKTPIPPSLEEFTGLD